MEIKSRNTNTLAPEVYRLLHEHGVNASSRNGPVRRFREPVTITLFAPEERVNFSPARDANPFFHLFEGLAMLANVNSVRLMSYFARNMATFSDDGRTYNAFYGTRMRSARGEGSVPVDQLRAVVENLRANLNSRQEVITLVDPQDLLRGTRDKACNLCLLFENDQNGNGLHMTSFNRSNDAIWGGVSGANIVHLSMIHEFVASAAGLFQGDWHHVSNNLHVYLDNPKWSKLRDPTASWPNPYESHRFWPMALRRSDEDPWEYLGYLQRTLGHAATALETWEWVEDSPYRFLNVVARPMWNAYRYYKMGQIDAALRFVGDIEASDWCMACRTWLSRRVSE